MADSSIHKQSLRSLAVSAGLFLGTAAFFLVSVFVLDSRSNPSPGWATQLVNDMWPILVGLGFGMGVWAIVVFLAGPAIVDERGVTNPYSLMRGRRIPWTEMERIRIVEVGGTQVGTIYFTLKRGRPKIMRLGIFQNPEDIIRRITDSAPVDVEVY